MDAEPTDNQTDLAAVFSLRVAAWRARTDYFPDIPEWRDRFDETALHWVVRDAGIIVAAARLTIHDRLACAPNAEIYSGVIDPALVGPIGVITRLVVAKSHAGRGLSRLLDQARINYAATAGCRHVIGETFAGRARIAAVEALGFIVIGESSPYSSGPLRHIDCSQSEDGEIMVNDRDVLTASPRSATVYMLNL